MRTNNAYVYEQRRVLMCNMLHFPQKTHHKNNFSVLSPGYLESYFIRFDLKKYSRDHLALSRPSTQECRQLDGWHEGKFREE